MRPMKTIALTLSKIFADKRKHKYSSRTLQLQSKSVYALHLLIVYFSEVMEAELNKGGMLKVVL